MSMDELLSRQVPQSLEAEQSVLGSMLIDERCGRFQPRGTSALLLSPAP